MPDGADPTVYEGDAKVQVTLTNAASLELLDAIGARRSSVFLSNCSIWVEGPTDRIIIRRYIDLVSQDRHESHRWMEDRDYSFVLYGGNLLEAWGFLSEDGPAAHRMCADALVICDGDIATKGDRLQRLRESIPDQLHVISAREIENTLTSQILAQIASEAEQVDISLLKLCSESKISSTKIGKIFSSMTSELPKPKKWEAKDGGLTNYWKTRVAQIAVNKMTGADDLSPAARDLSDRICEFIHNHNLPNV